MEEAVANSSNSYTYTTTNNTNTTNSAVVALVVPGVLHYLVLIIGIIGNSSLIVLISRQESLRHNAMNLYILNMAVSDLVLNTLALIDVTLFVMGRGWLLGSAACKMLRMVMVCCLYVTILSSVAVAFER